MKRFLFWFVGGLGALVLLVFIGLGFYTRTDHFRSWAREQLLSALRASVNGEVALERLSGSLWTGITFHNLSLRQNGQEVLLVPRGTLTFDLLPQLLSYVRSSSLHVGALILTAPVLNLSQNANTEWNIAALFRTTGDHTTETPSRLSIVVERIGVTDGQITIRPAVGETTHLNALSLVGRLGVLPACLQAELGTLSVAITRKGLPEVQWNGGVTYDTTQSPPALSLHQVDLRTVNSQIQLSGTVQDLSSPHLAMTIEAKQLAITDLRTLAPTLPLQQDLSGTLRANGPLSALQVEAALSTPDGQATTQVTANVTQPVPQYTGTLTVKDFAINKILSISALSGIINGHSTFVVTGRDLQQANFEIHSVQTLIRDQQIGTLTASGTLAQQQVSMTAATQGPLGDTQWRGRLTLGTPLVYDVTLAAHRLEITQLLQHPSLPPTTLQFEASIMGRGTRLEELDSTVKVTLSPSRIGAITDARGQFAATVRNGQITVETLSLLATDTTLSAQGTIATLRETPDGTFTYSLEAKNLTPWLALVQQDGKGAARLVGRASGTLAAFQLAGSATLTNLRVKDYSLADGTVTYALTGLGSEHAHGQATAIFTHLDAGIVWNTATLTLVLAGTQPLEIHTNFTGQNSMQHTQHVKGQLRYTPQRLEGLLQEISLQLPTGIWRLPQPARVLVQQQQQTISVENFRLQRADSSISAQGVLSFNGPQNLQLRVVGLTLDELRTLWATELQMSGHLSATAQIQGTAAQPEISADITTSALTVASQNYAGLTAHATYRQPQFQLTAALRQDATHTLSATGNIPLSLSWAGAFSFTPTGEGDFRIHSDGLSLAFLNLISPDIQDVQGTLRVDMQMRGPLQALTPTGQVWIENGQGRVAKLGLAFTEIGVAVQITPSAVLISSLRVHSGEGFLTGSGSIGLQSYTVTAIDLSVIADTFQIAHTRQYAGTVSGRLSSSGTLQHPMLQGTLDLHDISLRPDIEVLRSGPAPPDPTITVVRSADALPMMAPAPRSSRQVSGQSQRLENHEASTDTLYTRLGMDISVTIPRNTWMQLDEGALEFMGNLRARKNANEPVVLIGAIETIRGWYSLYSRKFRVERGEIRFTGLTPIDPSLDVVAQYTLPQYRVEIVVGGTARTPSLSLRSEPTLEQADILSLLIFGKATSALSTGEKTSLQSQALQSAAGYIASDLRRSLAEELGIENLELDVGRTLDRSRIGAGKYLSDDVFVSTSQQLGNTNSREFSIEYHLDQNWQIKATANTRGNDGIDIFWQKRY